jgi:hypothetical protein
MTGLLKVLSCQNLRTSVGVPAWSSGAQFFRTERVGSGGSVARYVHEQDEGVLSSSNFSRIVSTA